VVWCVVVCGSSACVWRWSLMSCHTHYASHEFICPPASSPTLSLVGMDMAIEEQHTRPEPILRIEFIIVCLSESCMMPKRSWHGLQRFHGR